MNQEETLALWKQGKESWNAWAYQQLEERARLVAKNEWQESGSKSAGGLLGENETTRNWIERSRSVLSQELFLQNIPKLDFSEYVFPGDIDIHPVTIPRSTHFSKCTFHGAFRMDNATHESPTFFNECNFELDVIIRGNKFTQRTYFTKCIFNGQVEFTDTQFEDFVVFAMSTFNHIADFQAVRFSNWANFRKCIFKNECAFPATHFETSATFEEVSFRGQSLFTDATFHDNATFADAHFYGPCMFEGAVFKRSAIFFRSRFNADASFYGVQVAQSLNFDFAFFNSIPNFIHLHCSEAVQLDQLSISESSLQILRLPLHWIKRPEYLLMIKYRSLKRLAIQAHDHRNESDFFARELLARLIFVDKPWQIIWWLNFLYGAISNYGRSVLRPLLLWAISVFIFAGSYLSAHIEISDYALINSLADVHPSELRDTLTCLRGNGSPVSAALDMSLRNSLVIANYDFVGAKEANHACLFGEELTKPVSTTAAIQDVRNLSLIQTLLSAGLIFFLLLAFRNLFKLK